MPEAPYVLLNLLSMAALAAFAWYITVRLPPLPRWLVWGWLMTLPWTLEFSTHIINPSYLLAPALVFFIGFFEAVPVFRLGKMPEPLAFALMGAAVSWVLQIHMSWPLLLPYAASRGSRPGSGGARSMAANAAGFAGGFLVFAVLLIPTFVVFGLQAGSGGTLRNLRPHWVNPWIAVTILARFFSFASLEIWRFIATDDGKRWMFLLRHLWIVPMAVVVWLAGIWQPIWMLREWFRTRSPFAEWRALKWLVAGTVALVYASYWFVLEPSQAHAFYVVAPVAFMFAAYCWTFVDSPRWRQDRRRRPGGERRVPCRSGVDSGAHEVALSQPRGRRDRDSPEAARDVRASPAVCASTEVRRLSRIRRGRTTASRTSSCPTRSSRGGLRRVALWTVTLRNSNARVAYRDVLYQTRYRDESGQVVVEQNDRIKDVFQPGAVVRLEVNDGLVTRPFATATIEVLDAEALLPLP